MKIAYLISAYTDPEQLPKLIKALTYKENEFYIYVDAKSDINEFKIAVDNNIEDKSRIHFIEKRIKVFWGGYSQVRSIWTLLNTAIQEGVDKKFDRYVYISAQDYPIWSNEKIEQYYKDNYNKQMLHGYNLTKSGNHVALSKIDHYAHWDINIKHERLFNKYRKILNDKVLKLFPHKIVYKDKNSTWDIYWGSDYFSMSPDCARYVAETFKNNRGFRKYMKYVFCPSELWVQTLVANSEYRNSMLIDDVYDFNVATVMQLVDYTSSIYVWKEEDYDTVVNSGKMFFRKVATGKSEGLLRLIEEKRNENN